MSTELLVFLTIALVRLALGSVFMLSGFTKLFDRHGFVKKVAAFGILPSSIAKAYGQCLPFVELFVGFLLVVGYQTLFATVLCVILLTSFIIAIVIVLTRGEALSCSCFGNTQNDVISRNTLFRDIFFLLSAFCVLFLHTDYDKFAVDHYALNVDSFINQGLPVAMTCLLITMIGILIYYAITTLRASLTK